VSPVGGSGKMDIKSLDEIIEEERRSKAAPSGDGAKVKRTGKKEVLVPLRPGIAALKTEELLSALLQTKKGLFGSPEKKLRKDIMKRLGVSEEEALKRGTLLAYSRLKDIDKALSRVLDRWKSEKKEKKVKKEARVVAKKAEESKKPEGKTPSRTGWEGKHGEEKHAEEDKDQAIAPAGGTVGGKDLPLTEIYKINKAKAAKKEPTFRIVDKRGSKAGMVSKEEKVGLAGPKTISPYISERAKRIQEILEEQRIIEEAEAQKKLERREKRRRTISSPFRAVSRGIRGMFGRMSHSVFVFFTTILSIPINLGKLVAKGVSGFLQGIYRRVGRFSPFGWKKKINMLIIYSGIEKTQIEITGITIVNGVVLAALVSTIGFFLLNWDLLLVVIAAIFSFGIVWVIIYSVINMMADKRTDEVENALPDVLQIVSANISAGMTPYNALWVSARKEFGALAEEIKIAQKETLGGKSFADALTDMGNRVRSNVLQRTIRLLIQGMKAGGELPQILQGIGNDIRQMRLLQKEMAANTMSYILFILFGMVLGAPLLFSVSIQFVDIMNRFQPEEMDIDISSAGAGPMMGGMQGFDMLSLGGGGCPKDFDRDGIADTWEREHGLNPKNSTDAQNINPELGITYLEQYERGAPPLPPSCIKPEYLEIFAMISLFSVGFFGSLLIGLIRKGKQSAGLKLAPLLVPATLGMFILMKTGMAFFFGSMFGT